MQNKILELENGAKLLGLPYEILNKNIGREIISDIFEKFKPNKVEGHLAVDSDTSVKLKTEDHEFSFSKDFEEEPIYLFFEQDEIHDGQVFVLQDGRALSDLLNECFGMEYFISNKEYKYLIAVNWYVIEICHSN
ncbi:MAG TPA: hypothetical protein PK776_07150 [Flavobacterium sp.]|nr:hypothetical protein [Flavobacterium sp.]